MGITTVQAAVSVCALCTGIAGVIALIFKIVRWVDRQKDQDEELRKLKATHEEDVDSLEEELTVVCYAMLACLDGLKQLGANGNVTQAHDALEKHLNQKAHK